MSSQSIFEENLKRLKDQYAKQLLGKIKLIMDDWLIIKTSWENEVLTRLHRNVHSLIGTSGTFGFSALSIQARELETALKPFTQASPESYDLPDIYQLIDKKLQKILEQAEQISNQKN